MLYMIEIAQSVFILIHFLKHKEQLRYTLTNNTNQLL